MRCAYPPGFRFGPELLSLGFRYLEGGSLRCLPFSMRSLVSGDFWGLPPNNQPFCGCRTPARTLAAAASLFLSLTAKDTGSQCFSRVSAPFSSRFLIASFFSHPAFPPCSVFVLAFITRLFESASVPARVRCCWTKSSYGRCRRGTEGWHCCLPVRSLRPAVA